MAFREPRKSVRLPRRGLGVGFVLFVLWSLLGVGVFALVVWAVVNHVTG